MLLGCVTEQKPDYSILEKRGHTEWRQIKFDRCELVVRSYLPKEIIVLRLFIRQATQGRPTRKTRGNPVAARRPFLTVASIDVAIDPKRCNLSEKGQQELWFRHCCW